MQILNHEKSLHTVWNTNYAKVVDIRGRKRDRKRIISKWEREIEIRNKKREKVNEKRYVLYYKERDK